MIELRPSDILFQQARKIRGFAGLFGQAAGLAIDLYNAQAVDQGNKWLLFEAQAQDAYDEGLPNRTFDVPVAPGETPYPGTDIATVSKRFGELSEADLITDHNKYVEAQMDWIKENLTNKDARNRAIYQVQQRAVSHLAATRVAWNEAAQHEFNASLNAYTELVMAKNIPWDQKVALVGERVRAGVGAARMWRDQGEVSMQKVTDAAQVSWATSRALTEMKAGGVEAGEKWIAENTPFWEGNPDARAKVLADVRAEWDKQGKQRDEELDRHLSDLFVRADSVEKIDVLSGELNNLQFHNGTQKITWDTWIRGKRERLEKGTEGAGEDVVSSLYSRMYGAADRNKNPGLEVTIREIDETVKDPQVHQALLAKRNELQKSYESGLGSTREDVLLAGYDIVFHPSMSVAAKQKWVDEKAKGGGGLSAEDAKKLRSWIDPYNQDPDRKNAMDAITTAYHLSMAGINVGMAEKKALALELYNAQNEMLKLFEKSGITKPEIDRAVESFLNKKAIKDLEGVVKQTTGADIGFATGEIRGKYREATIQEYLREQGKLTGEPAAQFPQDVRPKVEQLEKDALNKAKIKAEFTTRLTSGDLVYSTKPIAKGTTGKLLMSGAGEQGTLYQVRYQVKNGTYVPTVYTQNPQTGAFDVIAWEWK